MVQDVKKKGRPSLCLICCLVIGFGILLPIAVLIMVCCPEATAAGELLSLVGDVGSLFIRDTPPGSGSDPERHT